MNETLSKVLLTIEAFIFLLPVTLITVWYSHFLVLFYQQGMASEPLVAQAVPFFTFLGLLIQIIAWLVILLFIVKGRRKLAVLHRFYFYILYLGAAIATLSLVSFGLQAIGTEFIQQYDVLGSTLAVLSVNLIAVPAMVPFVHIALERFHAKRQLTSNYAIKGTSA